MKHLTLYALAFVSLLGFSGCQSESADGRYKTADEDVIETQIDEDAKASIDSLAKATRKGKITFALPDTLTDLLTQQRPKAKVAALPDQILAQNQSFVKDPLYIIGDFNGDQKRDYAVQVLENDSIHVLAFLDFARQAKLVKVATYPAQKLANGLFSVYQLRLAPKDSVVTDFRNQKKRPLGLDGVSVIEQTRTILYVLKNNRFLPFDQQLPPDQR
ncbi:hypothetical protein [Rufibacter sp. LB8]|uniref:hypothetical protein n=1 Tax=Rufibacter sp. LB8 TaxID=2777781 RepID=UPI00178C7448|nr:hypothetical protein [Rufibacter sp. LB8]